MSMASLNASRILDRVESTIRPGSGKASAFIFGSGDLVHGTVGMGMRYMHRYNSIWSGFVDGRVGYEYGTQRGLRFDALSGISGSW